MPGLPKRVSLLSFTERVVVINGERRVIAEALVFIYRSVPGALAEFGGGDLVVNPTKNLQPTLICSAWPVSAGIGRSEFAFQWLLCFCGHFVHSPWMYFSSASAQLA